jgi:hypothetical protein
MSPFNRQKELCNDISKMSELPFPVRCSLFLSDKEPSLLGSRDQVTRILRDLGVNNPDEDGELICLDDMAESPYLIRYSEQNLTLRPITDNDTVFWEVSRENINDDNQIS